VPSGLLPALELDGKLVTESLVIMSLLERTFPLNPMLPSSPAARADADELLRLERQLFGAWCDFVFRSSAFGRARAAFLASLARVESALGQSRAAGSAWLLGGEAPSIVDLQYVSHVERMVASILYWKGLDLRNNADFPNLEAWLRAFEARPAYLASKSDYYTHCWDIPPQYGEGVEDDTAEARAARAAIDGGAWRLPLPEADQLSFEPLPAAQQAGGQAAARQEAAFMLCRNAEAVARFAARGAGQPGRKRYGAPLADPTATPLEAAVEPTSAALCCDAWWRRCWATARRRRARWRRRCRAAWRTCACGWACRATCRSRRRCSCVRSSRRRWRAWPAPRRASLPRSRRKDTAGRREHVRRLCIALFKDQRAIDPPAGGSIIIIIPQARHCVSLCLLCSPTNCQTKSYGPAERSRGPRAGRALPPAHLPRLAHRRGQASRAAVCRPGAVYRELRGL